MFPGLYFSKSSADWMIRAHICNSSLFAHPAKPNAIIFPKMQDVKLSQTHCGNCCGQYGFPEHCSALIVLLEIEPGTFSDS